MSRMHETTYWCANFDFDEVLAKGLRIDAWLLQYQYEHDGFDFQGNRRQRRLIPEVWGFLCNVRVGDWLIAYLPNSARYPDSRFFGVGRVVGPKRREWQSDAPEHVDTVERTIRDGTHRFFDGVVRYGDAPALYEDFTDPWRLPIEGRERVKNHQPKTWQYPQRIDVAEWERVVPEGIKVSGLSTVAPLPLYRRPLFPVDSEFFDRVRERL